MRTLLTSVIATFAVSLSPSFGQENDATPDNDKPPQIIIAETPKAIDPALLMPEQLAEKISVEFTQAGLSEVGDWIRQNTGIPVLFDKSAIENIGVSLSEPVTDSLNEEPLYLLLDRLRSLNLSWYLKNDVVRITTKEAVENRTVTVPYPLGEFYDRGFEQEDLDNVILDALGGLWERNEGEGGTLEFLGDVLFVRQSDEVHRRLRGLFAALKKHGKRTYIFDPPKHDMLRSKLKTNVSVNFDDDPLIEVAATLSEKAGIDIRLDVPELRSLRIRERQPVSLTLEDRQLQTVLEVLLADQELTWMIRDGVMWMTSRDKASEFMITAVYDVRDLCETPNESMALQSAIASQTGVPWLDFDGEGGAITFAKPGTMVVRHTDPVHAKVLNLLDAYRTALKSSKVRESKDPDDDIITRYYSVQQVTAADLIEFIKATVEPKSWKTENNAEGVGSIDGMIPAGKKLLNQTPGKDKSIAAAAVAVDHVTLIITHRRGQQRLISDIIRRVQNGDERALDPVGLGGGLGGGGFGGGLFSVGE